MIYSSKKIEELVEPIVKSLGYELWGLDTASQESTLRIILYIDCEKGVGIKDCEKVSKHINNYFLYESEIEFDYNLEISSPGVNRVLFKPEHFNKYIGNEINLKLKTPINGRKNFTGHIKEADSLGFNLMCNEEIYNINYKTISLARLNG